MIFIGAEISNPDSHFRMNVVSSIGNGHDLLIDLDQTESKTEIFKAIEGYLETSNDDIVVYNPHSDEDFFFEMKTAFPQLKILMYFSDDEWRCHSYDRFIAMYSDAFTITATNHLPIYRNWQITNCIPTAWGGNADIFRPSESGIITPVISFVGKAYGQRVEAARKIVKKGFPLRLYGFGWDRFRDLRKYHRGTVTQEEMIKIFSTSQINLNFLWSSGDESIIQIKGRVFEIPFCKGFQLCNYSPELKKHFSINEDIGVFTDIENLLVKLEYYLSRPELCRQIAERSYRVALQRHQWSQRFNDIFQTMHSLPLPKHKIRKVLIVTNSDSTHLKHTDTLSIKVINKDDFSNLQTDSYTGIVFTETPEHLSTQQLLWSACALDWDKTDLVFNNFYLEQNDLPVWIRFRLIHLITFPVLRRLIPSYCVMYNPSTIRENCHCKSRYQSNHISVIEYPLARAKLPFSFIIRSIWGDYPRREVYHTSMKKGLLNQMLRCLFDTLASRTINLLTEKLKRHKAPTEIY